MSWDEIKTRVICAQAGDRAAYGELVRRFQPTVFAVALARLRNPGEAEELAQEVFVHAMTRLTQLRNPECFAGWLRQITVRMALNRLSRRGPAMTGEPILQESLPDDTAEPLDQLVQGEARRELYAGLARLKPLDRATLVAFYLRGRSLVQMSQEFETPVGTIKRRLHVARKRLKRHLEGVAEPVSETRRRGRGRRLACV